MKTYGATLNGLKDMIDDCNDAVLLEGLDYYLKVLIKSLPEFAEDLGTIYSAYIDLLADICNADGRKK